MMRAFLRLEWGEDGAAELIYGGGGGGLLPESLLPVELLFPELPKPPELLPKPPELLPKPPELLPKPPELLPKPPELLPNPPELLPNPPELPPSPLLPGMLPLCCKPVAPPPI